MDHHEELALLPLEDAEADRLLASVPGENRSDCWWLVLRDGTPVRGDRGAGVLLLTEMRLTRPVGRVLTMLRMSPVIDAFDKVLARSRKRLSRFVPEGPAPVRLPTTAGH